MSLPALLLLTAFLTFMAFALTALLLAARNAGEGFEDDAGFHGGKRRTNRSRSPRLVKPVLQEHLKIMLMPDVPISSLILAPGASPKPPRMNLHTEETSRIAAATSLLPVNLSVAGLNLQLNPSGPPAPKRKRKSVAGKDGSPDGTQLGFPGFAS